MIVDASGSSCIVVNVGIGGSSSTSVTRQLDIKVDVVLNSSLIFNYVVF